MVKSRVSQSTKPFPSLAGSDGHVKEKPLASLIR